MARYLLITTHYKPIIGGAMEVYDNLARHLKGDMAVVTAASDYAAQNQQCDHVAFDKAASYPIFRLPEITYAADHRDGAFKRLSRNFMVLRGIWMAVRILRTQAVVLTVPHRLGWLAAWLRFIMRRPVIFYIHGEEVATMATPAARRRLRRWLRHAAHIITPSRYSADVVAGLSGMPAEKISVIENGVDFRRFIGLLDGRQWRQELTISGPMVISLGRLVARKGFDKLIACFPAVLSAHPEAHLLIAGDGPQRAALKAMIEDSPAHQHIHLLGAISEADIVTLMSAANVFAMPNRQLGNGDTEGFGLVFLEAGLFGLPVVGGTAGGVPEAVHHGETGLLVDGTQPAEIASAINLILGDDHLRAQLSAGAKARAAKAGWAQKARQFQAILAAVVQH